MAPSSLSLIQTAQLPHYEEQVAVVVMAMPNLCN